MLKSSQKDFIKRHIGPSEADQQKMLNELGFDNLDDLISKTVPEKILLKEDLGIGCLLYTSPSPRDGLLSRMPSSA